MSSQTSQPADAQAAPAATPAAKPPKNRRGLFLRLLVVVVVIAAIAWTAWYFLEGRWYEGTDDAYVNGNVVQITPQIPGTVISIGADDGDRVHAGDVLVKLDKSNAEVALAEARANLASTVRKVRGLYSSVTGAQADVAARQVAVDKARADYNRRKDLARSGAISAEELAHAREELAAAESALTTTQQRLQTSKVLVDDTVVASHPDVQTAAARLRAAYLDNQRTTIVAPVDGYVAKRSVQLGQRVAPGMAMMAVVPLHQVWVDANFKETQLTKMRIGQPVEITSDVYGGDVTYRGTIESLGVGTGSAFSLLPAQNATGNWIKIVQRIPVRITFDDPKQLDRHPLRIGLSTTVDVNLHNQDGPMLSQQSPGKPILDTDVYEQQAAKADEMIEQIIHANMAGSHGK
ncbi:efflux RND transporter periplasmic adaptor subunit [Dyella sp.]|jgi:membrane fusion protein (multidrug efflux system)|uniref:efflux RND transporter periplasmic adaptor subunit n=1 Tax=Dyella sp. TaxID=1869338 RepID=UPI002D799FEE|nr:efflux RND transporter periplasmic adaptor subunit [Dyella sp.]HET6434033.1 efflux RND transporter periplasmic adaptor subunit [Dyella sp.]